MKINFFTSINYLCGAQENLVNFGFASHRKIDPLSITINQSPKQMTRCASEARLDQSEACRVRNTYFQYGRERIDVVKPQQAGCHLFGARVNKSRELSHGPKSKFMPCGIKVIVIGGGFGGLQVAKGLANSKVNVLLIDKSSHHVFQPLLFQVASTVLDPKMITIPIRDILRYPNVSILKATVTHVDKVEKKVILSDGQKLAYDYLVIAPGSRHSYFGHPEWEAQAPGLKTIQDALRIRKVLLKAFEEAKFSKTREEAINCLRFVIIGGGPTGVELAGAIAELTSKKLKQIPFKIKNENVKIYLIDPNSRLLSSYPSNLAAVAHRSLEKLGVKILLNNRVTKITHDRVQIANEISASSPGIVTGVPTKKPPVVSSQGVIPINLSPKQVTRCASEARPDQSETCRAKSTYFQYGGRERIDVAKPQQAGYHLLGARVNRAELRTPHPSLGKTPLSESTQEGKKYIKTRNVIWAAGNQAPDFLETLDVPMDKQKRVLVESDLTIPGNSELFVIGDAARVLDKEGDALPGVAQVAIQEGAFVSSIIRNEIPKAERRPFKYFDKGRIAIISKGQAILEVGSIHLSGFFAWIIWDIIHLWYLADCRNSIRVLWQWIVLQFNEFLTAFSESIASIMSRIYPNKIFRRVFG